MNDQININKQIVYMSIGEKVLKEKHKHWNNRSRPLFESSVYISIFIAIC